MAEKYEIINDKIVKDGHTMFLQDVLKDLERKSYLEDERKKKKQTTDKQLEHDGMLLGVNLTRKLNREEQKDLLYTLFGFNLEDFEGDGHYVLYDEEGYEFFATNANCKFNFDTLGGIFGYAAHVAKDKGILKTKHEIRKVLGIRD